MKANETAAKDNRDQKRVEVSEVIRVSRQANRQALSVNLSISARKDSCCRVRSRYPRTVSYQLSLEFEADSASAADGPLMIGVESLWCHSSSDQSQHWSGFYIIDISDQGLARIRQLTR